MILKNNSQRDLVTKINGVIWEQHSPLKEGEFCGTNVHQERILNQEQEFLTIQLNILSPWGNSRLSFKEKSESSKDIFNSTWIEEIEKTRHSNTFKQSGRQSNTRFLLG